MALPCDKPTECRLQLECPSVSTAVYYPPQIDLTGVNHNPDRNTTFRTVKCSTCGRKFDTSTQLGETTYTEVTIG
jgi:hypothetical protein